MGRYQRILVVASLVFVVLGCVTKPPVFEGFPTGRKVAIFQVPKPKEFMIFKATVYTGVFSGADSGNFWGDKLTGKNSKAFTEAASQKPIHVEDELEKRLMEELRLRGYEVTLLQMEDPVWTNNLPAWSELGIHADLVLSLNYFYIGYNSGSDFQSLKPMMSLHATVLDGPEGTEISKFDYTMTPQPTYDGAVYLKSDSVYRFSNVKKLMGSVDRALKGLVDSQGRIASAIASSLL